MAGWRAAPRSTRGGQLSHSDVAIETGLMLRLAFHLPLRQPEGLMASVFELLAVALSVPDHSTFSRRAMKLTSISKGCRLPDGPVHLLIDRTGLKVFGAGEWLQERHNARARRTWRKLHLGLDADTGTVMASILTGNDVGDPSQVAPLLDQIDAEIASVTADGAYDGIRLRAALTQVRRDHRSEMIHPAPDCFVGDCDPTFASKPRRRGSSM
jgi:hypothetical protein